MIQTHLGKLRYFCSPNILRFSLLGRWTFFFFFFFLKLLKFTVAGLRTKHVPKSKTHPRIQSTFLNSKILSRIQNTSENPHENISQNSKTLPRIQNTSQNPKTVPRIQNTYRNPKHFWNLGWVFRFWEVFLDCDCDQTENVHNILWTRCNS